jgi:hypothetical protein
MVPYHRPKSGHITCYLNRTYHVLLTVLLRNLDTGTRVPYGLGNDVGNPRFSSRRKISDSGGDSCL